VLEEYSIRLPTALHKLEFTKLLLAENDLIKALVSITSLGEI